jgi:hypothetical protein
MSEPKQTNSALEADNQTSEQQESKPVTVGLSRRTFLGAGSAGLATAALASFAVNARREQTLKRQNRIILQVIRARKTSRSWMKIRIQTFPHRRIMGTLTLFGTPSI